MYDPSYDPYPYKQYPHWKHVLLFLTITAISILLVATMYVLFG